MGLLSVIRKVKRQEGELRFLMVGLDNAGKTTLVKRLNNEDISTISPTLGFNIITLQFGKYRLNIWDVGGQKTIRSYWRNYYEHTDALVWVVDSADSARLGDCAAQLHALLQEERLAGATLLLLANKQDLGSARSAAQIEQALALGQLGQRHWRIAGVSAVSGAGLRDAFEWAVDDVRSRVCMLA